MNDGTADAPDQVVFGPAHHNDVRHEHVHQAGDPVRVAGKAHIHVHYHPGDRGAHSHPHQHVPFGEQGAGSLSWYQAAGREIPSPGQRACRGRSRWTRN